MAKLTLEKSHISSRRNAVIINAAAALVASGKIMFSRCFEMAETSRFWSSTIKLIELIELSNKMD